MRSARSVYVAALVWTALMVTLARARWLGAARDYITARTHREVTA